MGFTVLIGTFAGWLLRVHRQCVCHGLQREYNRLVRFSELCSLYYRRQWANGFGNVHVILIYFWRVRVLQGHHYARPAEMPWKSNVSIVLGTTTFASLAPSPLTSEPHFISWADGQEHILRQYPCIPWASSCVLGITASLVHTLRRYVFIGCLIWSA